MATSRLSERSRHILAALVSEYVETGEPVASQTLVTRGALGVSSATVRNVLAALEEQGYVCQPHTSAGRVPTDLGYRCYVDTLLEKRPGRSSQVEAQLLAFSRRTPLMDEAMSTVTHVVSEVSHHLGFAVVPETDDSAFERIDFVPLAGTRILVVVVTRGGHVSNKMVDIGEALSPDDLRQAANYLNDQFAGRPLGEVRSLVLARLAEERTLYDVLLSRALRLAQSTFEGTEAQHALFIEGAATLIEQTEGGISLGTLRTLLKMIEEKKRLVRLLTEYMEGPGLTVVIGAEHKNPDLREFSLVTASYSTGGRLGSIGVLGPTRMRYSRAIAVVDSAAKAITRLMQQGRG